MTALGGDQPLRRGDLAIDTAESVFATGLVIANDVAPGATRAQVDVADGHRRASNAPPALQVLRLGGGLEDEIARRIEKGGDDELTIGRHGQRDDGLTFDGHVFPPQSLAPADSR